ncbi:MAG TPA: M14 family zinc carboxypeptidase [Candidatus Thermoplasmatota archaeon]|nr:M14 family zinc carboxypeptidase [Candidatus Thermoplasmatota archaeon]
MKALLALLALLVFLVPSVPVAAQGVDPGIVCATNSVPMPMRESRVFCEPLDSVGFVQFDQFVAGVHTLADEYPDYVEVRQIGTSVQGRPILFVEVTNEKSIVPRDQKLQLGYSASIHANEAAGREGMTRVIEDLAAGKGPYGAQLQPLLDGMILNVWFPNPDSWASGDFFRADATGVLDDPGAPGYARANANGYDLNRQFPNPGWILPEHEPMSQPEARGVVSELRYSGNHTNLVAGADLHGMLNSPNMVRSIIPNQDYDFRRMVLVVDQLRQMQERIDGNPSFAEWNAVAEAGGSFEDAVGDLPVEPCLPDLATGAVCVNGPTDAIDKPFLWGARWDQIGYTDTGFTSDYMTLSPRSPTGGMGAVGQIVEFAYSHMVPDNKYVAKLTDMHVAGVREIVRTQMEQALRLDSPVLAGTGAVGYVWAPDWVTSDDDPNAYKAASGKDFSLLDEEAKFDFNQVPYNVSNLNFWRDLGRFSADPFVPIPAATLSTADLAQVKHLAITDQAIEHLGDRSVADIKAWVEGGGHLLLTDGAMRFFDHTGLAESAKLCVYLGHTDLQTRDHALVADVDWNARVTGEGPAIGFAIPQEYPQWGLAPGSVAALGGDLVGTTGNADLPLGGGERLAESYVHGDHVHGPSAVEAEAAPNTEVCQSDYTGLVESLGRVPLGKGTIDFLGAALPRPTQAYDHRYGLADYSVSAFTYWIVMNSLGGHVEYQPIDSPFVPTYDFDPLYGGEAQPAGGPDGGKDSPGIGLGVLLAALGVAAVLLARRR